MSTRVKVKLDDILAQNAVQAEPDWVKSIQNLLNLAREANKAYKFEKAIEHLNSLEEIWDAKGLPEFSLELRLDLYREKGKALAFQGKHDLAIKEYQKILKLCRDAEHLSVKSETFTQIGQLLAKQGDHDKALGYLQRAIGAYRRLNDLKGMCKALRNLGVVYVELGEFEEAELTYDEAIVNAQEIGDRLLYADLVNNLGTIMNMRGNWHRALELYRESLLIYETEKEIRKQAYTENNLAITLSEQGLNDEAFEYFQKAHETGTAINDATLVLIVDINLADLYLKKEQLSEAEFHCRKAHQYLVDSNLVNGNLVEIKKIFGKIARTRKELAAALEYFDEGLHISREIGAKFLEAEVLMERGILLRDMDRHFDSLENLESSYHMYTALKAEGKQEETERIIKSIEELYLEIFDLMSQKVDRKDKYTKGHSDRVASFALLLAKELGMKPQVLKSIVAAALLHDIGKIKINDRVLKKEGKLTEEEFELIKKHPGFGVELLRGKEFPWDIKPMILHHHEKLDGTGYPHGLKGEDIPTGVRIISIADVFDALTSDRVYRPAFDTGKALEIMEKESGSSFDPVLLKCFCNLIKAGKADMVINSKTREDEMYGIWSQCLSSKEEKKDDSLKKKKETVLA
ncbi:MAG: tetratricopeptide repeat protein [candidate division Zixibacteria bacterium]|nr:tetratricopeptide repeat protein [candidate division Zixibacteria bacterium]